MKRYLSHEEIIEKSNRINESYELDPQVFADIVDDLLDSDADTEEVILNGFQKLLTEVNHEIGRMEKHAGMEASCFKGCAFCCYFPIIVSKMEAKMLFRSIESFSHERKQYIYDQWEYYYSTQADKLEQAMKLDHTDEEIKFDYKKLNLPCPMLDPKTQACMAYEVRPIPCRTYLNYADPNVCAENHLPKEPFSYEFLYNDYFASLNEIIQALYENGEELFVEYPSDAWRYDFLPAWIQKWREGTIDEI
ncbi:YkgJ family cysteine cluster protein [Halobacillus sp. A5]|uniref:YkgJ family cysteine cluster protein n=1 Tax=Halobacillus sp. A5 TaxID=2880263 RepID=UPI0020A665D5|nr:YkgJ family cysteine cluster protein [Halobacillus sp. A5]MCP3029077.1 YkgJ family cysteine cluster protein [Halobacillus sp. A5]